MRSRKKAAGAILGILGAAVGLFALAGGGRSTAGGSASTSNAGTGTGSSPSLPTRRPGWYGARWQSNRPPELPANAYTAGETGGARNWGLALARELGNESMWVAAIDRLGNKESGWTVGLPAHVFGGNRRSWGAFQYLTSAVQSEPFFGAYQNVAPWFHPVEVELSAPMARYREQWNQAASRNREAGAAIAGVFLWQAAPAWRRRFWAALEEGASWQQALAAATSSRPEYYDTIAAYVNRVLSTGGQTSSSARYQVAANDDDLPSLSELRDQLGDEAFAS